jgi:hypothetical protein
MDIEGKTLPNFLLIGAGKAGTTAVFEYIRQHPQVYMSPVKEPNFFAFMGEKVNFSGPGEDKAINAQSVTDWTSYVRLFDKVTSESAIGEASHWYLYSPYAAQRIKTYLPNINMIAVLRDPVKRAYSDYLHFVREGREPYSNFLEAIQQEDYRIKNNWGFGHYVNRGLYYEQVKRYFDIFERGQLQIYLNKDLKDDAPKMMRSIFNFLEIDDSYTPDTSFRPNVSGVPKNKALHLFLSKSNPIRKIIEPVAPVALRKMAINLKGGNIEQSPLPDEVRQILIPRFREDILKLQDLIQRDLSDWLI